MYRFVWLTVVSRKLPPVRVGFSGNEAAVDLTSDILEVEPMGKCLVVQIRNVFVSRWGRRSRGHAGMRFCRFARLLGVRTRAFFVIIWRRCCRLVGRFWSCDVVWSFVGGHCVV